MAELEGVNRRCAELEEKLVDLQLRDEQTQAFAEESSTRRIMSVPPRDRLHDPQVPISLSTPTPRGTPRVYCYYITATTRKCNKTEYLYI